ncbi:galactosyltransferase-related protein [Virgibacillus sp. LDC-1]|uniref:galactosyltransferase-related protein n=1 Tax=Virgibacillus sp. LDC-1 TaxID=3039856 RepID=UPI0024DE4CEB|nr:galactosyltransferase-related protein [Virgibacillus sp. LDC-1]
MSIIIPISLNDTPRNQAFHWVKKYYQTMFPEAELCIGISNEKPFSKAKVINQAVGQSKGEILVLADADIFFDPNVLHQAIALLEDHAWVIPFQHVYNLSKESTLKLYDIEPQWPIPIELETRARPNAARGGINVVPRAHFNRVCGFDERFVGWGGEDDAFAASLNQLCGKAKRLNAYVYHLWHKRNNAGNYKENRELLKAYSAGKESVRREVEKRRAEGFTLEKENE